MGTSMKRRHEAKADEISLTSDDGAPPWLNVMRAITGTTEEPGDANNPRIIGMARYLGKKFPDQKDYWDIYQSDQTAWCGLTMAFCMGAATEDGISGPWGPMDTDKPMWALAWADSEAYAPLDGPMLGAVVVMEREGGGHVTCLEGVNSDGTYRCRGGNQSDAVNVQNYSPSQVVGLVWPKEYGDVPRRNLSEGDSGSDVKELQQMLGLAPADCDGDFGPTTEAAVRGFQRGWALDPDGEVGPATWGALDELQGKLEGERLNADMVDQNSERAERPAIARYPGEGRGTTPLGYAKGMALAWAVAVQDLAIGVSWAGVMAAAASGDPDDDVLSWFQERLDDLGWDCSQSSVDTMRHLWCILWALGPRESSGNHFCGRDQSASNTDADTCEAGAWQWSWNLATSSDAIGDLMDEYWADPSSFLEQWNEEQSTDPGNIENYGSGTGARSQWLSKFCPAFSAMVCSVGLRRRRSHWGPINRDELDW